MIDPERLVFGEGGSHRVVDLAARGEVRPQRFLERHSYGRTGEPGSFEAVDRPFEQCRRGRKIDCNTAAGIADDLPKSCESAFVVNVERHITETLKETGRDPLLIKTTGQMFLQRLFRAFAKSIVIKLGSGQIGRASCRERG